MVSKKIINKLLKLNPSIKYKDLNFRSDGRIEYICKDGVGHTIYSPIKNYTHGCCGEVVKGKFIPNCKDMKIYHNFKK
jgi:hypothetical protein